MSTFAMHRATLADLARVDGKAELIGGRIVAIMPTGDRPNEIAGNIFVSLKLHVRATDRGKAYTYGVGFVVPVLPSERESFSPDAAFYEGPLAANRMRFVPGAPTFAVEVRSENDYGPAPERALAAKRLDYFAAGTVVVWDVDPDAELIHAYHADAPDQPITYRKGQIATAEPAVPSWQIAVAEVFA